MKRTTLLAKLKTMSHNERVRRMIEVARTSRQDAALKSLLEELARGDWYERHLVHLAVGGSQDADAVVRFCSDPSQSLRRSARALLARIGSDQQIITELQQAPRAVRLSFLQRLRRRRSAIDTYLHQLAETSPADLALLLPFGSPNVVKHYFDLAAALGGAMFWQRLARLHPLLAATHLVQQAKTSPAPDLVLLRRTAAVLPVLGRTAPAEALQVVRTMEPHGTLPTSALFSLQMHLPGALADWFLAIPEPKQLSFDAVAHRLSPQQRRDILLRRPQLLPRAETWLHRLPPQERAELFTTIGSAWRSDDGVVSLYVLTCLPRTVRESEARRHLTLPVLSTQPAVRIQYAGLLSWDEAWPIIEPWLKHPEPELRIAALQAIFRTGRHDRAHLADLLNLACKRANEQDPVRLALATALADLPPSRWQLEHLPALEQIIEDSLKAADLSWGTTSQLQRLLTGLMPRQPEWAVRMIVRLAGDRGQVMFGNLQDRWSDADVQRLAPVLQPILEDWFDRAKIGPILSLAQSLGKRLAACDLLCVLLEKSLTARWVKWEAALSLALLMQHRRQLRATVIPRLLARDASWVTQTQVWQYLHRRRQDLLTPFLPARAYSGRFSSSKAKVILPIMSGFFRWTATQQRIFADTLTQAIEQDRRQATPSHLLTIRQLAGLPCEVAGTLIALFDDKRPAIAEKALRAVSRLDVLEQAVPALLQTMEDDRGRIAIYALRRAVLAMPAEQAGRILVDVPLEKVTIAKEVMRLLGELRTESAFRALQHFDAQALHRDVRIALLRALWDYLERSESWEIIDRSLQSAEPAIVSGLVRMPDDRLSAQSRERLVNMLIRLLKHPEPMVRCQVLERCVQEPIRDPQRRLLDALLGQLPSALPQERLAAAQAVFSVGVPADAARIAQVVREHHANRRLLLAVVESAVDQARTAPVRLQPILMAILAVLQPDAGGVTASIRLAAAAYRIAEFADWLIANVIGFHAEATMTAVRSAGHVRGETSELETAERKLAGQPDERLRRIALELLIAQSRRPPGWDPTRLERLRRWRQDSSALVAEAAQFTLPAEELGP